MVKTILIILIVKLIITITICYSLHNLIATPEWTSTPILQDDILSLVGSNFIILNWTPAKNTGFHFTTKLSYSKLNLDSYKDIAEYKFYPFQTDNISSIITSIFFTLIAESHWNSWIVINLEEATTYKLTGITSSTLLQFQILYIE